MATLGGACEASLSLTALPSADGNQFFVKVSSVGAGEQSHASNARGSLLVVLETVAAESHDRFAWQPEDGILGENERQGFRWRLKMRSYSMFVAAWVSSSWPAAAAAADEPLTCAQAYERAQEEKTTGQLKAAIEHLKRCVDKRCAKFIREDCVPWMEDAKRALPTVVFSIREGGNEITDVEILCDDKMLARMPNGEPIPVDPGLHDFTFNVPGLVPAERQVLIQKGERNRIIKVELGSPESIAPPPLPSPPPPSPASPPTPSLSAEPALSAKPNPPAAQSNLPSLAHALPYGLAGIGALGVVGFAVFAIRGTSQKGDLERSCSPFCQSGQVDSAKTKYVLADTSLGVGLVSLGVATYLLVKRHGESSRTRDAATSVSFIPQSSGSGGVLELSTPY
jgi:hypothetical protein